MLFFRTYVFVLPHDVVRCASSLGYLSVLFVTPSRSLQCPLVNPFNTRCRRTLPISLHLITRLPIQYCIRVACIYALSLLLLSLSSVLLSCNVLRNFAWKILMIDFLLMPAVHWYPCYVMWFLLCPPSMPYPCTLCPPRPITITCC